MIKQNLLLKLKQIFTLKRILKGLVSLFLILFFAGGCSFKYMDWQYYKFMWLMKNESGRYIYDEKLYNEINQNGINTKLSNGYFVITNSQEEFDIKIINSRLKEYKTFILYYIDSNGNKHIIMHNKNFSYFNYGLWFKGDEGAGFWLETEKVIGGYLPNNKF
ncbi:hypothetical protein DCO58_08145 [Helicobacter saguini]|uniref:Uncharacterized protein n=1 Tax=Helicobacter saguini TaxID=1548018 RepID=A0A347VXA7_9HELI|nr:hypothetical protein [Helicobacter saguini]MWV61704.1 hypothetical protein [Helicobacter saguini]MWV67624.1 hypothetical protein [Helicobacter saguini]MWV69975.1 hypothetical protein [Helicobacter saguini]MWV72811.1 hypothetical protein [Helicobacter saguini]TLD91999.1 hypothetical protein LS64_011115 [Helicobacter saguini]